VNQLITPICAVACVFATIASMPSSANAKPSKYGQFAPDDAYLDGSPLAYYGSENEWSRRQFSQKKADRSYKRRGQRQLLEILNGNPKQAIAWGDARLFVDANDQESLFTRAVAWTQLGQLDQATDAVKQAVSAGMPIERFLAGPRHLLHPLTESEPFRALAAAQLASPLIHGPMLGCLTHESVRIWVRTVDASPVTVHVFACDETGKPTDKLIQTATATTDAQADFTATIEVTGLQPDTVYAYDVLVAGSSVLNDKHKHFHTFPLQGKSGRFRIAFGGGAGYIPEHERIWDTIASYQPDALLLLGDNVYIDLPEEPRGLHRYTYYRRQSRFEFRQLVGSTPVYAIWDDHDCAMDDVWLGPFLDRPVWKQPMLTVFRENWVNPSYGNEQAPGCWFKTSIADVDFFFLDTRNYRTNPRGKQPTMLGPVQKKWFRRELERSQAKLKVLVSSVPWAPESKPGSRDTWDGFPDERAEIFSWIDESKIDGVVLLSADRHRSEARKIDRPDAYPLYDLMSSRLTNTHKHECLPGTLFCYNATCSFGLLSFDTTLDDPSIKYDIVTIDGKIVNTLELKLNHLRHP